MLKVEHVGLDDGLQLGMLNRSGLRETATTRLTLGEAISQRSTPSLTMPVAPKRRIFMSLLSFDARQGFRASPLPHLTYFY